MIGWHLQACPRPICQTGEGSEAQVTRESVTFEGEATRLRRRNETSAAPDRPQNGATSRNEQGPVPDRALQLPACSSAHRHCNRDLSGGRWRDARFPNSWVAGFEVFVSAVTLVMVFAIQHTQGREQAATQRKLDELIRALPGADESLMMLEEAPRALMLDVENEQRDVRSTSLETDNG